MTQDSMYNPDILDELEQFIYIADFKTFDLLFINKACMREFNCSVRKGQKCYELLYGRTSPCTFCSKNSFKSGVLRTENYFNEKKGKAYQIQDKCIHYNGNQAHLVTANDITNQENHQKTLSEFLNNEKNLIDTIQILNGPDKLDQRMSMAFQTIGEYFQADRVYAMILNSAGKSASSTFEWCASGIIPQKNILSKQNIRFMDLWLPFFEKNEIVSVPDIEMIRDSRPEEYAVMKNLGIRSFLETPAFVQGQLTGFIGMDNPAPEKLIHTSELMLSFAYSVSNAVLRNQNEQQLRETNNRFDIIADASGMGMWEYHIKEHKITSPSHSFQKFGVPDEIANVPQSILPMFPPDDQKKLTEMFHRLDEGENVQYDFWITWKPGTEPQCERVRYAIIEDENGKPDVAYGFGMNITAQKKAQEHFRHSIEAILTQNPLAISSAHINLTQNKYLESHGILQQEKSQLSSDDFFALVTQIIPYQEEKKAFNELFNRKHLLKMFDEGKTLSTFEYHRTLSNGEIHWVRSHLTIIQDPESNDIEAAVYTEDADAEHRNDAVLSIVTDQDYDLFAVFSAENGHFTFWKNRENLKFTAPHDKLTYDDDIRFAFKIVHPDSWEKDFDQINLSRIKQELRTSSIYSYEFIVEDQSRKTFHKSVNFRYVDNTHQEILMTRSDITDHYLLQQKEAEANKYQHSLQELLNANPDAIGTIHVDITRDQCDEFHRSSYFNVEVDSKNTITDLIKNVAEAIPDEKEHEAFLSCFAPKNMLDAFNSGTSMIQYEYHRKGTDGRLFWIRTSIHMLRNPESGNIEGVFYSIDTTHQKNQEEVLRIISGQEYLFVGLLHLPEKKLEYLSLNENLPDAYKGYLKKNKLYDYDSIREKSIAERVIPEDREKYRTCSECEYIIKKLNESGKYDFIYLTHLSGPDIPVTCNKIQHYYFDPNHTSILIIASDITEVYRLRQKELEAAQSEKLRMAEILDSISVGISALHMDEGKHLHTDYTNRRLIDLLGFTQVYKDLKAGKVTAETKQLEYYLQYPANMVHPDDREWVVKTFLENCESQGFFMPPYRLRKKDGSYLWITQRTQLQHTHLKEHFFYSVYLDTSKEIELQNQLANQLENEKELRRQADLANSAKSDFLSRMSHDMRTPLNGIIGMSHIAQQQELTDRARNCLKKIDVSSNFLLGLINDVLDMAKIENSGIELHPEPYLFTEFIDYLKAVIQPLCEEKNIHFVMDAQPVMGRTPIMDKLRINQIVFNILSNAVKFTPEGGTVTFKLREIYNEKDSSISQTIEISDTGIGISPEFQDHLFEVFAQEQRKDTSPQRGSGLGLAITKKLVELMNGDITFKSDIGKGTTFIIQMKFDSISTDQIPSKKAETPKYFEILKGKHILLCEDHPLNQEIAKALLEEKGIITEIASNGEEGIAFFEKSSLNFFDAILMDLRMPVMDGYEATRKLRTLERSDAKTIPIIAMTADAFTDDMKHAKSVGINGYVTKPIEPDKLYQVILKAVLQRENEHGILPNSNCD